MLVIGVELLTGVYVATAYNDRNEGEWPPHPARVYSALVATWATGDRDSEQSRAELEALRWLETLGAPEILATSIQHVASRTVVPVFVPVNDVSLVTGPDRAKLDDAELALAGADGKARDKLVKEVTKLQTKLATDTAKAIAPPTKLTKTFAEDVDKLLLDRRARQPRTFPAKVPEHPDFAFVWRDVDVTPHRAALERLLGRLVRVGHSSTLVRGFLGDKTYVDTMRALVETYTEDADVGHLMVRWVGAGQFDRLEEAFALHQETEPRTLPARFVRYREGRSTRSTTTPRSVFSDELIVFARRDGARLPITSVVGVARQFRRALMSVAGTPTPTIISGHADDGGPADRAHLSVVPLPSVLGQYADGSLLGVALVLPREVSAEERKHVFQAITALEARSGERADARGNAPIRLLLGDAPDLLLVRDEWGEDQRRTLQRGTWCQPARRWASVTPVALDKNPGDLHHADPTVRARAFLDASAIVRDAVARIGLPPPIEVDVLRSAVLPGTAKPRMYPRYPIDSKRPQRVLAHVRLVFAEPVSGPVLIGAGRYHGLGLCLPIPDGRTR